MKEKEINSVRDMAFKMDYTVGGIGCHVDILEDIHTNFTITVQGMDGAVERGEEMIYYREHHRELRILSELMYYAMAELEKEYEQIHKLKEDFFEKVVKKKEVSG